MKQEDVECIEIHRQKRDTREKQGMIYYLCHQLGQEKSCTEVMRRHSTIKNMRRKMKSENS